jgi:poly-gamma-glutamate capsule biosynthesis protein CapA/YwtB (metallophosphatase superfamily)
VSFLPRRTITVAFVAGLLAVSACSTPAKQPLTSAPSPSMKPSADAESATPGAPSPVTKTQPGTFTLAVAGDIHFAGRNRPLLDDPATAVGPISAVFKHADLAIANLESAITEGGSPQPKQFTFRAPPSAFDAFASAGLDAAIMANNHALDFGLAGLNDTLADAKAHHFPVVGIGKNADSAYAPYVTTVRGTRVAILALSQIRELSSSWTARADRPGEASGLDIPRSVAAVRAARAVADVVVVYIHWGKEGDQCPTPAMRTLARALSAAGADAIVSTHAHLLLGDGWMGKTFIAYGMGNFVWWRDNSFSNDTGVLTLTFHGREVTNAAFTPARITSNGQPLVAVGAQGQRISAKYAALRGCTGLANRAS